MWVLIVMIGFNSVSPMMTAVPGFSSVATCRAAGDQLATQFLEQRGIPRVMTVCVNAT
jgi:hypothetical protein